MKKLVSLVVLLIGLVALGMFEGCKSDGGRRSDATRIETLASPVGADPTGSIGAQGDSCPRHGDGMHGGLGMPDSCCSGGSGMHGDGGMGNCGMHAGGGMPDSSGTAGGGMHGDSGMGGGGMHGGGMGGGHGH